MLCPAPRKLIQFSDSNHNKYFNNFPNIFNILGAYNAYERPGKVGFYRINVGK